MLRCFRGHVDAQSVRFMFFLFVAFFFLQMQPSPGRAARPTSLTAPRAPRLAAVTTLTARGATRATSSLRPSRPRLLRTRTTTTTTATAALGRWATRLARAGARPTVVPRVTKTSSAGASLLAGTTTTTSRLRRGLPALRSWILATRGSAAVGLRNSPLVGRLLALLSSLTSTLRSSTISWVVVFFRSILNVDQFPFSIFFSDTPVFRTIENRRI